MIELITLRARSTILSISSALKRVTSRKSETFTAVKAFAASGSVTSLLSGDECFEKFDLSYYGSPSETGGFSAYHQMKAVFDLCKNYAENFKPSTVSLLFRGSPGVGKTYLSACIARVVAGKGYSVCYDTAASALEAFELRKFARDPETAETAGVKVRRMLDCDLMILDDLGTEMTTYISISALYTLINTRLLTGKPTIISTNLLDDELEKRYSPQICSRIQGEYSTLQFAGADARRRNKG